MPKKCKIHKKFIFSSFGIVFCMLIICSCNSKTNKKESPVNLAILNSESNSEETDYYTYYHGTFEDVYSAELEVDGEIIPIDISNNIRNYSDVRIKINGQEVSTDPKSRCASLGYAHAETKTYDFTGDGKEEIALISSGGARGAQAIQIFQNIEGEWKEMDLPSEIYDDPPNFVQEKLEELNAETAPLTASSCEPPFFSFEDKTILVHYRFTDADDRFIDLGTVQKELFFSSDEKRFILGDTLFIPAENG